MSCACLLDYAIKRSSYRFQIRLLLIRVYKLLGLPLRALDQWKALGAKQIQIDTLAHYGMDRSYFWSLVTTDSSQHANGRLEAPSPFLEQLTRMDGWYSLGLSETSDSIFKVWTKGIWQKVYLFDLLQNLQESHYAAQVAEYHELYDRLSNSLTQANLRLNRTMVAGAMPTVQESIGRDQLLDSLEALQPVSHWSDNRDDSLLPLSVRELSEVGPKSNVRRNRFKLHNNF